MNTWTKLLGKQILDIKLLESFKTLKRIYALDKEQRLELTSEVELLYDKLNIGLEYRRHEIKDQDDKSRIYPLTNGIYGKRGSIWLESLENMRSVYAMTSNHELKIKIVNGLENIVTNHNTPSWPMNGHKHEPGKNNGSDANTNGKYR